MLFKSGLVTSISGSIGGLTGSHNRGGLYFRGRVIPVHPNTAQQEFVTAAMAQFTNRWQGTLSQAQREAWDVYALNTPLTGPLGDTRNVGGIGMYIRGNIARSQAGLPIADDAPIVFTVGGFTPLTAPTAADASDLVGFAYDNTDDWANEDDASLLVYVGRPQNPGINYFNGPYRFAGQVDGDAITPPTSPASITSPFVLAAGQRAFWRCRVTRADGRYSAHQNMTAIVV